MNSYDELTYLFNQHHLSQQQTPSLHPLQQVQSIEQPQQQQEAVEVPAPIVYSITQHYHHSAHVARPTTDAATVSIILSRHGVDANTLNDGQLSLFVNGNATQQMRLVELWRISPPSAGGHANQQGSWQETSFQREEELGQLRYETAEMEEQAARRSLEQYNNNDMREDVMSDSDTSTPDGPVTPILGGDGRWSQAGHVEPYMMSGYETLAAKEYEASMQAGSGYVRATDPVYKTISDIHHYPNVGIYNHHAMDEDMML